MLDDPRADAAVQALLNRACAEIQSLLGEGLEAVLLLGGYGRGEGGAYLARDGYCLVNDLDLRVFVRGDLQLSQRRYAAPLRELAHRLLQDGKGLKEIDLRLDSRRRYRLWRPNTVSYCEMAGAHQVICGDLRTGRVLPLLNPARLPAYEGTRYFRNRGCGLLIASAYFFKNGLESQERRKNFQIEVQKACQAMGDAWLLMERRYHPSYAERLKRFRELASSPCSLPRDLLDRVAPLYEWGMTRKLLPCFEWPGEPATRERWFDVRDTFLDFFLWYESRRLGRRMADWIDYAGNILKRGAGEPAEARLRSLFLSWLHLPRREPSTLQRSRQSLARMPLLLAALSRDLQARPDLVQAAACLSGMHGQQADLDLWKTLVRERLLMDYGGSMVIADAVDLFSDMVER